MVASYEVVLIHKGLDQFASEIEKAVRDAAAKVLLQSSLNLLDFKYAISAVSPGSHVAVVYLGSTAGCGDRAVKDALEKAVRCQFPVLPIVRKQESGTVREKLPCVIKHVNTADWDDSPTEALIALLGMLGLVEQERKVFLSYRRSESTQVALQLHTELARRRFDVFLDRFALPPGEDFQRRLDEDLGDKAFVVLLESSDLRSSQWVQHEIAYAHSHRIDVLAITLPGVSDQQLVPVIDDAFRIRLAESDLAQDGQLTDQKLDAILELIEFAHAKALRRRREQMLGSLRDKLHMDGCTCVPLKDWAILATATCRKPAVFLMTPRRPQPEDLYAVHLVRRDVTDSTGRGKLSGTVVHEVEHIADEQRNVLAWIAKTGQLKVRKLRECALEEETAA